MKVVVANSISERGTSRLKALQNNNTEVFPRQPRTDYILFIKKTFRFWLNILLSAC